MIEFLEARVKMTEEKQDHGTDTPTFKAAEKSFKTKEDALKAFLKPLAKSIIGSGLPGALADWQSAITEYHVKHNDYKKSKYSLGSEQGERLREEPKNDYTRRIPKTYDPQAKAWPLLLVVQDKGKLSKQVTSPMPKAGRRPEGASSPHAPLLDGEGDLQGHVTVAVDIPDAVWDDPQKLYAAILRPLGDVRSVLRIDPNRVVIGGIGRGAKAAASVVRFAPQFFSAFVAKGGEPGDVRPENFANIPVYILGDASAWEKPPEGADGADKESWLSRAKSLGIEVAQDPESKLPELTTWLSKRVRNPYTPHAQSVVKTDRRQSATYWLKFDLIRRARRGWKRRSIAPRIPSISRATE